MGESTVFLQALAQSSIERGQDMEKRILGRTGMEVSAIGWGGPALSGDKSKLEEIWDAAYRSGLNFLDTAPSYGNSEELIGEQLSHRRDEFLIATKSHPVDADNSLRELESSLKRLKVDYVDLFYTPHGCSTEQQLEDTMKKGGVLEGCVRAKELGLTKHTGFSFDFFQELDIRRLRELIDTDAFDVVQFPHSLVRTEPVEEEIIPYAREKKMGTVANFPTVSGITAREWGVFHSIFKGYVDTPGQATLLYIIAHPGVDMVLSRFSSPTRAVENCYAGRVIERLSEQQRQKILDDVAAFGPGPFRQREECPDSPLGSEFRTGMIFYDMYTRFGYGGARSRAEALAKRLIELGDFEWSPEVRKIVEEVKRAFPVSLFE